MLFNYKEEAMHKQRLAAMIAAAIGMIATFLPWVTGSMVGSVAGTVGDGWISFGLFAIALILALLGDRTQPMVGGRRMGVAILGLLTAVYGVWKMMDFKSTFDSVSGTELGAEIASSFAIGIGVYLVIAAGALLLILPFMLGGRSADPPVVTSPA
jgi:hypothetical protein